MNPRIGIAGRSNDQNISDSYPISAGLSTFRILDFGHSYLLSADASLRVGFRVSCFEFIENPISKQFSLSQQVISLNDVALGYGVNSQRKGC